MEKKLIGILTAFIFLVIGLALVVSLADSQTAVTQTVTASDETVALVNGTPINLAHGIVRTVTTVVNASNATQTVAAVNYTLTLPQAITLRNDRSGNYNVTYTYSGVTDTISPVFLTLTILFFVIAILMGTLYYLNDNFREFINGIGK